MIRIGVLAASVALAAAAAVGGLSGDDGPERDLLVVSGRDDHGLLAAPTVDLLDAPEGTPVATVADDTLVRVVSTDAEWIEVSPLDDPDVGGWVNDHHLRGTLHVVGKEPACPVPFTGEPGGGVVGAFEPSLQVELVDAHPDPEGRWWLGVRSVKDPTLVGLVPRERLAQLPGPVPTPGVPCEAIEPDPEARPHRH